MEGCLYAFSFLFTFSCRIIIDDISVWYSDISSSLIGSVELCGSSLEDCHLCENSGNTVLWNLFCWRRHAMWCYLLLNVLAISWWNFIFMQLYIFFLQSLMYKSNAKVAGQIVREYQRQCSTPLMFSWCKNNSMLKIKTLFRRLFSVTLFNLHKAETINRKMTQVLMVWFKSSACSIHPES